MMYYPASMLKWFVHNILTNTAEIHNLNPLISNKREKIRAYQLTCKYNTICFYDSSNTVFINTFTSNKTSRYTDQKNFTHNLLMSFIRLCYLRIKIVLLVISSFKSKHKVYKTILKYERHCDSRSVTYLDFVLHYSRLITKHCGCDKTPQTNLQLKSKVTYCHYFRSSAVVSYPQHMFLQYWRAKIVTSLLKV